MELRFFPLDFDYEVKEETVWMRLYGRLEGGGKICVLHRYQPYFYARAGPIDEELLPPQLQRLSQESAGQARVVSWEKVEKELLGKKQFFWKIYTNYPKAVPVLSKELESLGVECYERDILFVHRYLRDQGLTPMTLVRARGEFKVDEAFRVPVFVADEVQQESQEAVQQLSILALDIETYAERREIDPVKNPISSPTL